MKRAWLSLAAGVLAFSPLARGEEIFGQLLSTTRSTPVFSQPSARARVLADADSGVKLMLRGLSPSGTWLYVEDEDRNRGWVPRNRTDYAFSAARLAPPPTSPKDGPHLEGQRVFNEEREERESERASSPRVTHRLAGRARRTAGGLGGIDPNGNSALGFTYAFLAPGWMPGRGDEARASLVGFEFGYLSARDDGTTGDHRAFTIPVRYRMLAHGVGSALESGPDMGLMYFRRADARSRWSFSAGWTLGWAMSSLPLFADLRLGFELLNGARLSGEFTLGLAL